MANIESEHSLAYARPWVRETTYSLQGFYPKGIPTLRAIHRTVPFQPQWKRCGEKTPLTLLAEDFVDLRQETVDFATPVPLSVAPNL